MTHSHCKTCNGLTEEEFTYCREHCPSETSWFASITHSMVATPGVLTSGVCGNCGYPDKNLSFYSYRIFECANKNCPHKQEHSSAVYYQRILRGRENVETNPFCPKCKKELVFQRESNENPAIQFWRNDKEQGQNMPEGTAVKKKLLCQVK